MLCVGNDLLLQCISQVTEIIDVSSPADYQAPTLVRSLLGGPQGGGIDHIELDMMSIQLEVGSHQLNQSLVSGKHLGRELLIKQSAAGAGVIHFRDRTYCSSGPHRSAPPTGETPSGNGVQARRPPGVAPVTEPM